VKGIAVPRFALVLACLCSATFALDDPVELAKRFLKAHESRNRGRQAILASQAAGTAPYALAVHWLLLRGHREAAAALVEQRQGPEREGLKRLLEVGLGARPEAFQALARAEAALAGNKPVAALQALPAADGLAEGSVIAAMAAWTRARALASGAGRTPEEAARACLEAARLARACGWLSKAREAARLAAVHGREPDTRLAGADAWLELSRLLDDPDGRIAALDRRASLHEAVAGALAQRAAAEPDQAKRQKTNKEAAAARERARQDYSDAIGLARQQGRLATQARLTAKLALHWHFVERRLKSARVFYGKAETLLDAASEPDLLSKVRRNLAVVLTQLGRYGDAVARLDKLLAGAAPPYDEGERAALAQRAYALWRSGSTERAAGAYERVLEVTADDAVRARLHVEAGELQLQRGDLAAARRHFDAVLENDPDHVDALASRARARGLAGDEQGARADFAAALAAADSDRERVRVLLFRAQQERSWGRIADASRTAAAALAAAREAEDANYLNVGVTWLLNADLALLRGDREAALKHLERGGVLFVNLGEPYNAVSAYAREALLLTEAGRPDEALQRLTVIRHLAKTTPADTLKSLAFGVESFLEARNGRLERARDAARKALAHARSAGDRERAATARLQLARLAESGGFVEVEAALDALDARLVAGPEWHPPVDGERADHAEGIGLSVLLRDEDMPSAERARHGYRLIERARRERILVALRGRRAVLRRTLEPAAYHEYLRHRNAVLQARAEDERVEEAEAVFREVVKLWRDEEQLPGLSLAFPRRARLEDLQAKLRDGDVFVGMLDDPYARALVVVTRTGAALRAYDPEKPAAAIADELEAAKRLVVAPDGRWAVQPFPAGSVPVVYATSGSAYPGGEPVLAREVHRIPDAIPLDFDYPRATGAGRWLADPVEAALVVAPDTTPARRARNPRAEGATALVEALAIGGARYVALSLHRATPPQLVDRFVANCRDRKQAPPVALREAREWYRARNPDAPQTKWAALVLYRTG